MWGAPVAPLRLPLFLGGSWANPAVVRGDDGDGGCGAGGGCIHMLLVSDSGVSSSPHVPPAQEAERFGLLVLGRNKLQFGYHGYWLGCARICSPVAPAAELGPGPRPAVALPSESSPTGLSRCCPPSSSPSRRLSKANRAAPSSSQGVRGQVSLLLPIRRH